MGDARFNGNSQYQVLPPKGKKEIGYTRVSTVSKLLEDPNSLINWRVRQTMKGLVRRADLINMVLAHPDDSRALDRVAADALEAADASAGANSGTALHAIMHRWGDGDPVNLLEGMQMAVDLEAVKRLYATTGVTLVPGWNEHMIVHHKSKVAGTFDCLLKLPDGRVVIGDYKTTKTGSVAYAFGGWAIQLGLYANGTAYRQDPKPGEDRYPDFPAGFDPNIGMIIHVPVGEGRAEFFELDLRAGWEAAKHALWAREWRTRKDLVLPWPDRTAGALAASLAAVDVDVDLDDEVEASIGSPVVVETSHGLAAVVAPAPVASLADILTPRAPDFMPNNTLAAMTAERGISGLTAPVTPVAVPASTKGLLDLIPDAVPAPPVAVPAPPVAAPAVPAVSAVPAVPATQHGLIPERSILSPDFATGLAAIQQVFPGATANTAEQAHKADIDEQLRRQSREGIASRIRYLKAVYPEAFAGLVYDWPLIDGAPIPGFVGDHQHTKTELRAIEQVVERVEDKLGLPFPAETPPRPKAVPVALPFETPAAVVAGRDAALMFAERQATVNGPPVEQTDIDVLAARLRALPPAALATFKTLGDEAAAAGWRMNVSGTKAMRQYAIATMLVYAAENGVDEAAMIKSCIRHHFYPADIEEADVVGGLSIDDALTMARMFEGLKPGGDWCLMFTSDTGAAYLSEMPF